jgi:hypothetical protein
MAKAIPKPSLSVRMRVSIKQGRHLEVRWPKDATGTITAFAGDLAFVKADGTAVFYGRTYRKGCGWWVPKSVLSPILKAPSSATPKKKVIKPKKKI